VPARERVGIRREAYAGPVRRALEDLLRDMTLFTIGAAVVLARTLVDLASAIGYTVVGFVQRSDSNSIPPGLDALGLSVRAGNHVLYLGGVLGSAVAFAFVLCVVLLVARRRGAAAARPRP
jgi:hypothetical protein